MKTKDKLQAQIASIIIDYHMEAFTIFEKQKKIKKFQVSKYAKRIVELLKG